MGVKGSCAPECLRWSVVPGFLCVASLFSVFFCCSRSGPYLRPFGGSFAVGCISPHRWVSCLCIVECRGVGTLVRAHLEQLVRGGGGGGVSLERKNASKRLRGQRCVLLLLLLLLLAFAFAFAFACVCCPWFSAEKEQAVTALDGCNGSLCLRRCSGDRERPVFHDR